MESHKIGDHNQIVVRRSTFKAILGSVASLLFLAFFAFVALTIALPASASFEDLPLSLLRMVFAAAGAIMSTAFFIFYGRQLFSSNPLLVIDNDGITDHASWLSVGPIRWEEIEAIFAPNHYLVIVPRDIEVIMARQRPIKRVVLSANTRFTRNRIIIPGLLMSTSTSALLTQATAMYSEKIIEHSIGVYIVR
jgi:hypothetical protein